VTLIAPGLIFVKPFSEEGQKAVDLNTGTVIMGRR